LAEAAELRRWLESGANAVKRARERLDAINVFPVADSDTGTNIYLTLKEGNRAIDELPKNAPHKDVVAAFARGALLGARGNSGVIVSAYLNAFLTHVDSRGGLSAATAADIAAALDVAAKAAYSSVGTPVEGTILTVAKAAAVAAQGAVASGAAREGTIVSAVVGARTALAQTQAELGPAREAGVVDAGALGLVVIVRGALAALAGESVTLPEIEHYAPARLSDVHHAESEYRYCVNFIVLGEGLSTTAHVPALEGIGDSVLVVGDEATLKVHVHADDPDAARAIFEGVGSIEREDIADMREQIAEREARLRETRTGVLAVVSGAGMLRLFSELGAHVIDGGPTMNPSTNDLVKGIEDVGTDEVVVLPNSKNVHMAAEEAARLSDREVRVVPTVSQQGALAALVEHEPSAPAEDNAARLVDALSYIRIGGVAPAAKDDPEGRFVRGDTVGFEGDDVIAWGGTGSTLAATVSRLAGGAEIVTIIEGEMPPIALDDLDLDLPDDVELEVHRGGQPSWYWLIAAQ